MRYWPIPEKFRTKINCTYPAHQRGDLIEEFAEKYFADKPDVNGFTYIPLHWCAWHVNHGYGREKEACVELLRDMPKGRYFTIAQYDGGTLIDDFLTEKGVVTFVQDCRIPHNIIIPLLCDPHPVEVNDQCQWLCSFVGSFTTHPVRKQLRAMYEGRSGFYFGQGHGGNGTALFRNVMRDSTFTLCPRGSGITSFRMFEAVQVGSIPIYISDIHRKPFENKINWDEFCVTLKLEEIDKVEQIVRSMKRPQVEAMRQKCRDVTARYFNMKGTCDEIMEILKTL